MKTWQKIFLLGSVTTILIVWYYCWPQKKTEETPQHNQAAVLVASTNYTEQLTPVKTPLNLLREHTKTCQQRQKELTQQHYELTAAKLTQQWRNLLMNGVSLEQLFKDMVAIEELIPYHQNLFDQKSHLLANEQQLQVLAGSDQDFEQLFADIDMPIQEPVTAEQWEQTLSHFAASSNFYNMVFLNHRRHWHGSRVISPSLIFIANIDKVEPSVALRLLNQLRLYPTHIAHAIEQQLDDQLIEWMLQRGEAVDTMPLFRQQPEGNSAAFNLADVALQAGRANLLPLLARYSIEPTQLTGFYSAIDNYLIGVNRLNRQREMREQCPTLQDCFQLNHEQIVMVQQLAASGHQLYPLTIDDGLPRRLLWFDAVDALEPWQQSSLIREEQSGKLSQTQQLTDTMAEAWQQLMSDMPDCITNQDSLKVLEAFWSKSQVSELLSHYQQIYNGQTLLSVLNEIEPALIVALQQQQSAHTPARMSRQEIQDYLAFNRIWRSVAEVHTFTEQTSLTAHLTDELLFWLIQYPNEVALWQQRFQPVAPQSLRMFTFTEVEQWQRLVANRFDFHLLDQYGMSIYRAAFAHPEAESLVELLLELGIPLQHNQFGPDAIHLALDWSYQHGNLFPLLVEMFMQPVRLDESHFKRLRRLQLFYPQQYSELQQLVPAIKLPDTAGEINFLSSLE